MGKKKKRKEKDESEKNYSPELNGILLILISIIGW